MDFFCLVGGFFGFFVVWFFTALLQKSGDLASNLDPSQESMHDLGQGYFTTPGLQASAFVADYKHLSSAWQA